MKALKYLGISLGIILLIVICLGAYLKIALPNTGPAPTFTIERTPERIERGKYLANSVTLCMDCHSTRDWSKYSGPMLPDSIGGGGEIFDQQMGFPGKWYASNITPYKLSDWTDGEIYHAITTGVNKSGRALFNIMGYHRFGKMDEEDIKSLVVYLRTLSPVQKDVPAGEPDFPFGFILNILPTTAAPQKIPSEKDVLAYGGYIMNAAGCIDCHSKREKGEIVPGSEFGGGMEFAQPAGVARSVNITMDKETGIGNWSKEMFVRKFKMYADSGYVIPDIAANEVNTPMPWKMYSNMKEKDLEAIYTYLTSVKIISNKVNSFEKK